MCSYSLQIQYHPHATTYRVIAGAVNEAAHRLLKKADQTFAISNVAMLPDLWRFTAGRSFATADVRRGANPERDATRPRHYCVSNQVGAETPRVPEAGDVTGRVNR